MRGCHFQDWVIKDCGFHLGSARALSLSPESLSSSGKPAVSHEAALWGDFPPEDQGLQQPRELT